MGLAGRVPVKKAHSAAESADQVLTGPKIMQDLVEYPILLSPLGAAVPAKQKRVLRHPGWKQVAAHFRPSLLRRRSETFNVGRAVAVAEFLARHRAKTMGDHLHR